MGRYLFFRHGADCRKRDRHGGFPMLLAAAYGHLEIVRWPRWLSQVGGAYWLILNGALGNSYLLDFWSIAK